MIERDVGVEGRRVGQGRQGAVRRERDANRRLDEAGLRHVELAVQQRRDGELEVEVMDRQAQRRLVVADHRLAEHELGSGQQLDVDIAADRHPLPERLAEPCLDERALPVPVDEIRPHQRRGERDDEHDGEACEKFAQGTLGVAVRLGFPCPSRTAFPRETGGIRLSSARYRRCRRAARGFWRVAGASATGSGGAAASAVIAATLAIAGAAAATIVPAPNVRRSLPSSTSANFRAIASKPPGA